MDRKDFIKKSIYKGMDGAGKAYTGIQKGRRWVQGKITEEITDALGVKKEPNPYHPQIKSRVKRETGNRYIRPPGAVAEKKFQELCTGGGDCIDACPHHTLYTFQADTKKRKIKPTEGPVLDPNLNACRLCEDWPCVNACPTGALDAGRVEQFLPYFGKATVDNGSCTRDIYADTCDLCLEECPIEDAIVPHPDADKSIASFSFYIDPDHCIGCGLCVSACPTFPKSIFVYRIRDESP